MWRKTVLVAIFALAVGLPETAAAESIVSWGSVARMVRDVIFKDHESTFYCGCPYSKVGKSAVIDLQACGYRARKSEKRASRIEAEHIMPASWFGNTRTCWKKGNPSCVSSSGKMEPGRECCYRSDEEFRTAHNDLHNLVPAVGEINGDRSSYRYGEIAGEARVYGSCDFEVDSKNDVAEPAEAIRGFIARVSLYMIDRYGIDVSPSYYDMFMAWDAEFPPDAWEFERNRRIVAVQGNGNPWLERWGAVMPDIAGSSSR